MSPWKELRFLTDAEQADINLLHEGVMTMRKHVLVGVAGISLTLAAAPLRAHHAFSAEFDADKPLKLEGAISKTEWVNPHAWIHIDVKKPDGTTEEWMIEGGTPNTLMRRGVSRDTLKIGTAVIVTGYQAKDGSNRANGRDIIYPDGRKLFLGSEGTGAPSDKGPKDK
jgi:uncharacterized protein DUF6152